MKQLAKLVALMFMIVGVEGCKKSNNGPDANVYVPAWLWDNNYPGDHPVYWENSTLKYLSCDYGGKANALFADNGNIYVGGQLKKDPSGQMLPVIWKNNVPQYLSDSFGAVNDLLVQNDKVYAVGYIKSFGVTVPVFWDDGVQTILSIKNGTANAVSFSNNNIYIGGGMNDPTQTFYTFPIIWSNGDVIYTGKSHGIITSVCLANGHVYAAVTKTNGSNNNAVLLEDTTESVYSNHGDAKSVSYSNNSVYLSGGVNMNATDYMPVVWKNGTVDTFLIHPSISEELFAATVKNNDYFAVGQDSKTKTIFLWVNGAKQSLSIPGLNCIISKIFVQ